MGCTLQVGQPLFCHASILQTQGRHIVSWAVRDDRAVGTCQFLHRCLAGRGASGRWGAWALGKSSACHLCLHDSAWPGFLPAHHL